MARVLLVVLALDAFATGNNSAWAHGLGQRYDLPLPLWLYLLGAGSAVAASCAFLLLFRRRGGGAEPEAILAKGTVPNAFVTMLRSLSVALFVLIVAAGLLGNQNPFKNIAPIFVWVLWWVGFAFVCAFVVNLWPMISPFCAIFSATERLWIRANGRALSAGLRYPGWLAAWPSVLLLLLFACFELVAPNRDAPRVIALAVVAYCCLTWCGFALFGRCIWLRSGEVFSLYFGLLGRFAPIHIETAGQQWTWVVRPFGFGLLARQPLSLSMTAFTLLMLATVTADGFMETPLWAALVEQLRPASLSPLERISPPRWPALVLLCLAPALFGLIYAGIMRVIAGMVPASPPTSYLAGRFVLTLVPIAIGYHLAHYLSFLLLAGQFAIPLASDPLGFGWDLFGTALYRIDIGIIDARTVWFVALAAIVGGHILATWLAHETALDVFRKPRAVRLSQVPILALMVGYTVLSLWILAQPIVETRP